MIVLVTTVLFLSAALAIPISRAKTGDFLAPPALIVATWCGTLGLYFLGFFPYPPMKSGTFALIVATILVMVAGAMLGQHLGGTARSGLQNRGPLDMDRWVIAYAVIGLLGVAWYVSEVVHALGWRAFEYGEPIRIALGKYVIPSRFLFLEYFCITTPLLAFALIVCGARLKPWVLAGPAACVLASWITTDRTQFFVIVLGSFFMYLYRWGSQLSWMGMIRAGGICAILLVTCFLTVGSWVGKTPSVLGVRMEIPTGSSSSVGRLVARFGPRGSQSLDRWLQRGATLYLYCTGSFAALDGLLEEELGLTKGAYTFYPFARLLQRAGIIKGSIPPAIPPDQPLRLRAKKDIEFNGYTFLYYPLMDFGRTGALIYAACVGLLSGWFYGRARSYRDSPLHLLILSQLATALVLSVFVNKFNNTASWYVAVFTILPFVVVRIRPHSGDSIRATAN